MFPLNDVLTDLRAAGFTAKELARKSEDELSYLYNTLIMDKEFWERRLQKPAATNPAYPDPNISLAETLATMPAEEKAALRERIRRA